MTYVKTLVKSQKYQTSFVPEASQEESRVDGDNDVDDDTLSGLLQEQQGYETALVLFTLQAVIKPQQTSSNYPDNLRPP